MQMRMTRTPMAPAGTRSALGDREAGSVTVFFVVAVVALFAMVGLVVDGGTKIRTAQQAAALAEEAARAAGQDITLAAAVRGDTIAADPGRAAAAARTYLAENGLTGTVWITNNGAAVTVTVSVTKPTVFLSLIGIASVTVTGRAEARLVRGLSKEEPS